MQKYLIWINNTTTQKHDFNENIDVPVEGRVLKSKAPSLASLIPNPTVHSLSRHVSMELSCQITKKKLERKHDGVEIS